MVTAGRLRADTFFKPVTPASSMITRLCTVSAAMLLLMSLAAPVAGGAIWEPEDFIFTVIVNPSPGYAMKAEDYLANANLARDACAREEVVYNNNVKAFLDRGGVFTPQEIAVLRDPNPEQQVFLEAKARSYDEDTAGSYERMMTACIWAQRNYNKALDMTKDDDYAMQAEIFEAGAGIYDTLGYRQQAEQVRDAAAVARAHAAASELFLPLSPLAAVAGLLGACSLLQRLRR